MCFAVTEARAVESAVRGALDGLRQDRAFGQGRGEEVRVVRPPRQYGAVAAEQREHRRLPEIRRFEDACEIFGVDDPVGDAVERAARSLDPQDRKSVV